MPEGRADLTARVADAEYLGAETRLLLDHRHAEGLALILPGRVALAPGETVGLRLPERHRVRFGAHAAAAPARDRGPVAASPGARDGREAALPSTATPEDTT